MDRQRGQATIEWIAVVLVVSVAFGALVSAAPVVDGRSLGGTLAHRLTCAMKGGCDDGDSALASAYGRADAELVRRHMPGLVFEPGERQIPVDWRQCREVRCATVSDERDMDIHRSDAGRQATVFTHLVRRSDRRYIQYWTYYPDSNTTLARSDWLWRHSLALQGAGLLLTGSSKYPGFHRDDWEGIEVQIDGVGRAGIRVTSHGHWQWCKFRGCEGEWGPETGWSRVSRGSHSGHVPIDGRSGRRPLLPGIDLQERTASSDAIRLVPLEIVARDRYRPLDAEIEPPWRKRVYENPASSDS